LGKKKKWKICVYMIAKNEEDFVDRVMDSIAEADLVVVGDTGSNDNTIQKFRDRGARVHSLNLEEFRFDAARNATLDLVPKDIDICVSLDCDEVLQDGWYQDLQENWKDETTRASYLLNYAFDDKENVTIHFNANWVHAREGYRWKYAIHETLYRIFDTPENKIKLNKFIHNHHPKPGKKSGNFIHLHEISAEENNDFHSLFCLIREYHNVSMYRECTEVLRKFLALPGTRWDLQTAAACCYAGEAYMKLGDIANAKITFFTSIVECPARWREHYYLLAKLYYDEKEYKFSLFFLEKGLEIKNKDISYIEKDKYYGYLMWDYAALSAFYLNLKEKAIEYGKKALEFLPGDERLIKNLEHYNKMC